MLKGMTLAAISVLALTAFPQPASAGNNGGAVAAGVIGGLAVGAIIGSQANRNYYSGPAYVEPAPVYESPAYVDCHYEREHFIGRDGYEHVRRIRVCD